MQLNAMPSIKNSKSLKFYFPELGEGQIRMLNRMVRQAIIERICLVCYKPIKITKNKVKTVCSCP